jgi:hypothetical protein
MPGFSFSPSIRNHRVALLLKSGKQLTGTVVNVDPTQVAIRLSKDDDKIVLVNRDEITAYTGCDDKKRLPVSPKLVVTRCCNPIMRCNGVKMIRAEKVKISSCELHTEHCEVYHGDFFTMSQDSQHKLLLGVDVGQFPKRQKEEKDDGKHQK